MLSTILQVFGAIFLILIGLRIVINIAVAILRYFLKRSLRKTLRKMSLVQLSHDDICNGSCKLPNSGRGESALQSAPTPVSTGTPVRKRAPAKRSSAKTITKKVAKRK